MIVALHNTLGPGFIICDEQDDCAPLVQVILSNEAAIDESEGLTQFKNEVYTAFIRLMISEGYMLYKLTDPDPGDFTEVEVEGLEKTLEEWGKST